MYRLILPFSLLLISSCGNGGQPGEGSEPTAPIEVHNLATAKPASVPANLPVLAAELLEAGPGADLPNGGSMDTVTLDPVTNTITVYGWVQIKSAEPAPTLKVYAPGALSLGPVVRLVRDDVSTALGDLDLRFSGFNLKIQTSPEIPVTDLCITTSDSIYGEKLLVAQPGAELSCSVLAEAK